jgi:hypothetical protein
MFVVSYIISATIMSSIRYDMFDRINGATQLTLYPLGMSTLLVGVYFLMVDKQFKFEEWKWLNCLVSTLPCCCPRDDESNPASRLLKVDHVASDGTVELVEKGKGVADVEEKKEP